MLSSYSVKDGINHAEVYPMYRDRRNRIWIGTTKGLSNYENGRFAPLEVTPASTNGPPDEVAAALEGTIRRPRPSTERSTGRRPAAVTASNPEPRP